MDSENICAVSYTQLDVYKRQDDSYTMIIFGFADTYWGSSDLSEDMVIKLKEFVQKGKSVMSVSYPHLDVYKRQRLHH